MTKRQKSFLYPLCLSLLMVVLIFIDFTTKSSIYHHLPYISDFSAPYPYGGMGLFENFLGIEGSICLALNHGAAWSLLAGFQFPLLVLRMVLIVGMIIYLFWMNREPRLDIGLLLIISGAVGNVIDYFLYGAVVDFIHFKFWGWSFPIFNIADVLISIGVCWILAVQFILKRRAAKNAS